MPNEREQSTVAVSVKVPEGVIPFSFEATPGWKRKVENDSSGAASVIRWTGRLPSDGFVRFAMLASTPPKVGPIAWKAVQRYSDGFESAWIGPPDSENPAPVTLITRAAERENAGGENDSASGSSPSGVEEDRADGDGSGGDLLPIVLAALAIVLSLAALAIALRRRNGTTPGR